MSYARDHRRMGRVRRSPHPKTSGPVAQPRRYTIAMVVQVPCPRAWISDLVGELECCRARRTGRPRLNQLGVTASLDDAGPRSTTRIWSASLHGAESRWAITIDVRPAKTFFSARWTATSDSESRWAVASSSTTTSGGL